MGCVIELRDVDFSARGRLLARNLRFRFEEGKTVSIVGPSGGGKSTVLKLAAGLCIPDSGEVFFRGTALGRMGAQENLAFRKESAFVFQDAALWANQTLFETLELPLRVHFPSMTPAERKRRVEDVAAGVGCRRDLGVRPSELSRGEQKLVAFARAVVCGPSLLFLDEWTESLDENSARRLTGMVRRMRESGVSVIFVSHDARIVRALSDAVLLVRGGEIAFRLSGEQVAAEGELERLMELGAA